MKIIEGTFKHKGVTFEVIQRGEKAVMLKATAPFYDCNSVEVWQIRKAKASIISGNHIAEREIKPSNEDYPHRAHQFMQKHFSDDFHAMMAEADKRFNQYENGERPQESRFV